MKKHRITFFLLYWILSTLLIHAAEPYTATNYDEPYRGQFHFSQPSGWMNDLNGMWYNNGVYNITCQAYPYSLDGLAKSWGHATSTDMMHWTQISNALDPDVNVPGDCWSGSAVVDVNNTSGFGSVDNPPLVIIYTATSKGTCLAYSNDQGVNWTAYSGNPVNVAGPNEQTRDPHVFWHEPTGKWVCVIMENGFTFYNSSDLKTWTKTGNYNWGWECPDIFELSIDGGAEKKWVLLQADGKYHIGNFNGLNFIPDAGGPYSMVKNAGIGAGFYASQTFFRNNFSDERVVQMAWMSGFGVGSTSPWTHNSTFPAEVKLKTFPEGIRAARTPIVEISSLYGNTQNWSNQSLQSGENLFAGKLSKCFDAEVTFDLSNSTATTVTFQFANRVITYDLKNNTLLGNVLNPINNQVKIRFLVDWGELEVFGNDGQFSYAENFKFTPSNSFVSMTANGSVNLVSARFSTINRTWPGTPNNTYADNADTGNTYSGNWLNLSGESVYYNSTCHVATSAGAYVQYPFSGTQVAWYGLKNDDLGMATVYIDGTMVADDIDCYSTSRISQQLFFKTGLANGNHTIKIVTKGTKNAASKGIALVHDYFGFIAAPSLPTAIDDASTSTSYSGTWVTDVNDIYYSTTCHVSNTANSSFQTTFTGTQVFWYGLKNDDLGMADVFIDGVLAAEVIDCYSTTKAVNILFSKTDLPKASHTIKVMVKGTKNPSSSGTAVVHDYFDFPQILPTIIDDASASTTYNGTWTTDNNEIYYNNTCHVGKNINSYFQTTFTGTQVSWYGLKNNDLGMATVYVDGILAQDNIDCYSGSPRAVYLLFNKTGLSNGDHTIKVVVKGTKNIASNGVALVHDYFSVLPSTNPSITFSGNLAFGDVKKNVSSTKTLTINNSDTKVISVTSIELPAGFTTDWNSGDIAASGHQNVNITFAPTIENLYSGFVKINTDTGIFTKEVSGTGINAHTMNTLLPNNSNILYMGRIDFSDPEKPLFAYPNVTIKAKFEGTSLNMLLKDYNGSDFSNNYFQYIVDGGTPTKFVVTSSQENYPIAKNLTNENHTVEITKITETYNGECQFLGFQTDTLKTLIAPEPFPDLKLEFFGNSITCGYGIEGGTQPVSDNSYKAYPAVTARELNAQFHTISYSGIGVVKGFPSFLMSQMYNRIVANTSYNPLPTNNVWDFTRYIPDYVIVALGTNDYNLGFGSGTISFATFYVGYNSLITKIRTAYPNTHIICTNSPMISDSKLGNAISSVVTTLTTAGDNKIHYFSFTQMQGGGSGGHPGVTDGQTNGKELAEFIKSLINSTAINENKKNTDDIKIFPNPAKMNLSITHLSPGSQISVIGLDAKTISSQYIATSTANFNVSNWNKGIYLFNIQEKNSVTVRKVMID
ncbi:MAG: GDSL-type esterase/lipase family protein [Paludibacter sp.]